jgi:hypothetical protein
VSDLRIREAELDDWFRDLYLSPGAPGVTGPKLTEVPTP